MSNSFFIKKGPFKISDIIESLKLENNLIDKELDKNYVYTGCQILSKKLFLNETIKKFSISKIWHQLIDSRDLYGYESKRNFYHLTNLEIFKKLKGL